MFFVYFHSENGLAGVQHRTGYIPGYDLNRPNRRKASYNLPGLAITGGAREGTVVDRSQEVPEA